MYRMCKVYIFCTLYGSKTKRSRELNYTIFAFAAKKQKKQANSKKDIVVFTQNSYILFADYACFML